MEQKSILPNKLRLYLADAINKKTNERSRWYVVGKNEDVAFMRWSEYENDDIMRYNYTFREITDNNEIIQFKNTYGSRIGVYQIK